MRVRRLLIVAVAVPMLVGASLAGTTGCGGANRISVTVAVAPGPSASLESSADVQPSAGAGSADPSPVGAASDLLSGAAKLRDHNLTFTLGDGIARADGQWDATASAVTLSRVVDGRKSTVSVFGNDLYLIGMVPDGSVLHLAVDQIPQTSRLLPETAPLLALPLLATATRVQRGSAEFTGVVDLTRVDLSGSAALRRLVDYLSRQAGDRAREIQFTATVDGVGRLGSFRATFPKADAGQDLQYELVIAQVGGSVSVVRPSTPVVEVSAAAISW
jgi:hypothetical protein